MVEDVERITSCSIQGTVLSERSHCRIEEITTNTRQYSGNPVQELRLEAPEYKGVLTTQP
jgi:hypothetical protein